LNKLPATCPKCNHEFDPTVVVRAKRKPARREIPESKKDVVVPTVLASKKPPVRRKDAKNADEQRAGEGGIGDIAEMEEVDDIESLRDLSELEEREEPPVSGDDTDDEAIIEELDAGDKTIVGNIEEEEASALVEEIDDDAREPAKAKKEKSKKKPK
jgi:hypothetical protein